MPDCGPLKVSEYVPNYEETAATVAGREAAQELMKLLSCDFEGLVINSKRVSELFEEKVLKETGRESGNWVSSDLVPERDHGHGECQDDVEVLHPGDQSFPDRAG